MKISRLQVGSETKIESLVKEIINSSGKQVILEVAAEASLLNSEVNLRLIKFYAEEEEKEVIIEAVDPILIALAQRLGISTIREKEAEAEAEAETIASSYKRGQAEVAAVPEFNRTRRIKKSASAGKNGLFFAILVMVFSLIVALWWLTQPQAIVTVFAEEKRLAFETQATIGTVYTEENIKDAKLPGHLLEQTSVLKVQTVTTGAKTIGFTAATGRVTFINSSAQNIVLPKNTSILGKAGVKFLTDKDIMIPKKSTKYQFGMAVGETFGQAEVGVTANQKGTIGNQPAKALSVVEGRYQRILKVVNLTPTSGGSNKKVSVVSLEDVKKGELEAKRQAQLIGPEEMMVLAGKDYLYLPGLVRLDLIRLTNSPEIGGEGDLLQTSLEYRSSLLTASLTSIEKLLKLEYERNIPANFKAKNGKVQLTGVKVLETETEPIVILQGNGRVKGNLNPKLIKELIKGKGLTESKELLIARDEVRDCKISLINQGKQLPPFAFQIKVLIPSQAGN